MEGARERGERRDVGVDFLWLEFHYWRSGSRRERQGSFLIIMRVVSRIILSTVCIKWFVLTKHSDNSKFVVQEISNFDVVSSDFP